MNVASVWTDYGENEAETVLLPVGKQDSEWAFCISMSPAPRPHPPGYSHQIHGCPEAGGPGHRDDVNVAGAV